MTAAQYIQKKMVEHNINMTLYNLNTGDGGEGMCTHIT